MAFEVRATILHEMMRESGKLLFIDTITGKNGPDVGQKMAADLQTNLELAMNSRGQASAATNLSRLQG